MRLYRPSWNLYGIEIDRYGDGVLEEYWEEATDKRMKEKYPSLIERIIHYPRKKEIKKDIWNQMNKIIRLNGLERMYNKRMEEFFSVYSNKEGALKQRMQDLHYDFKEYFKVDLKTEIEYIK